MWSLPHMAHHRDLNTYLVGKFSVSLPLYPLDPWDPTDLSVQLYQHQLLHNAQNELLGIAGQDLLDVDWNDPTQRAEWIFLNAQEHFQASTLTGVG